MPDMSVVGPASLLCHFGYFFDLSFLLLASLNAPCSSHFSRRSELSESPPTSLIDFSFIGSPSFGGLTLVGFFKNSPPSFQHSGPGPQRFSRKFFFSSAGFIASCDAPPPCPPPPPRCPPSQHCCSGTFFFWPFQTSYGALPLPIFPSVCFPVPVISASLLQSEN